MTDHLEPKPYAVVHPDGRKTDEELFEPMLGEDRWPEDVDYGPRAKAHKEKKADAR
jgi:hypothetical protein